MKSVVRVENGELRVGRGEYMGRGEVGLKV